MARLTDRKIRALKAKDRPQRAFDGRGLYLEITPSGSRYWRLKYRFAGKERLLALGVYPEVSLAKARADRDAARALLRDGVDPSVAKKAEKLKAKLAGAESFEAVAREWLGKQQAKLSPATYEKAVWTFEELLFPWLGTRPVGQITAAEVLATLRRIENRGHGLLPVSWTPC